MGVIKQNNPNIKISYTLPCAPDGLVDGQGLFVLQDAQTVQPNFLNSVSIMVMDFGPAANGNNAMATLCIKGIESTKAQIATIGFSNNILIDVIPMIGVNDTTTEIFGLEDAQTLLEYCQANTKTVNCLSFWSIGRDKNPSGQLGTYASATESGVIQEPYQFSKIFGQYKK
jgi:hypothetical protein